MPERLKSPGMPGEAVAISEPSITVVDSEDSTQVSFGAPWTSTSDAEAVGGTFLRNNSGGSLSFYFKGASIWVRFKFGSDAGNTTVKVDEATKTIDLYNAQDMYKYVNVAVGLNNTVRHKVTITVAGTKNASSTDYYVNVDAFAYRYSAEALTIHDIEYIDLINVINVINKINQIGLISTIANIQLLSTITKINELSTVGTIQSISGISTIANISSLGSLSTVELIEKIDLIDVINLIQVIQKISQIGMISQISDIAGISAIGHIGMISQISDVAGISTIGKINQISDIGGISTIGKINQISDITGISDIGSIGMISQISDIAGISSIGLIKVISQISTVGNISTIGEISEISLIRSIQNAIISSNPIRNPFFLRSTEPWWNIDPYGTGGSYNEIVDDPLGTWDYAAKLIDTDDPVGQLVWADTNLYPHLTFFAYKPAVGGGDMWYQVIYTDGTDTSAELSLLNNWTIYDITLTSNKRIRSVDFWTEADGLICYLYAPCLIESQLLELNLIKVISQISTIGTISQLSSLGNLSSVSSDAYSSIRWGITREPTWTDTTLLSSMGALSDLTSILVTNNKTGRIYGVHISSPEANEFNLYWDATVKKRFALAAAGVVHIVLALPLISAVTGDGVKKYWLKNVNAGTAGKAYQVGLLYDETP